MNEVCNSMSALNRCPRRDPVRRGKRIILKVANRRWVEQHVGSKQSCCASRFGKPLVVADQYTEFQESRLEYLVAKIARLKITLFVEERVVRNVNFSICAQKGSIRIDNNSGI